MGKNAKNNLGIKLAYDQLPSSLPASPRDFLPYSSIKNIAIGIWENFSQILSKILSQRRRDNKASFRLPSKLNQNV